MVRRKGKITDLSRYEGKETKNMQRCFSRYIRNTEYYVGRKVGRFVRTIESRNVYFSSSAFVDIVHRVQLEVTGAQMSFASPSSFIAVIRKGDVRDMFNLYRYDNVLYTMRLTGREIKDILEMGYGLWTVQMKSPDDHVMLLDNVLDERRKLGFKKLAYNFDLTTGICYTVDMTKSYGEKIRVSGIADGGAFELGAWYTVAVNSYRGNGGGELLTKGVGIPHEKLNDCLLSATEKDLRTCIIEYIRRKGSDTRPLYQWRLVPEE